MHVSKKWKLLLEELDQAEQKADDAIIESEDKSEDKDEETSEDKAMDDIDGGDSDSSVMDVDVSADDEDKDEETPEEPPSDEEAPSEEDDSDEFGAADAGVDDTGVMDELKQIYTPILIMQGLETKESCDRYKESCSYSGVLTEKNVIKFDNDTRVAQLLSVCALLLARKKNSEQWQAFKKAAAIQRKMKIEIQKEEAAAAKALARKFLDEVSSGDNKEAADSASKLLPEIDS